MFLEMSQGMLMVPETLIRLYNIVSSALALILKTQFYSNVSDIIGTNFSVMQISNFMFAYMQFHLGDTLGMCGKLHSAEANCIEIQKTHRRTHINYPLASAVLFLL